MSDLSETLLEDLRSLEKRINDEISRKQKDLHYQVEKRKVKFEKDQVAKFKKVKVNLISYLWGSSIITALTIPVIYFMIFPAVFFDISAGLYQHICFPIYRIPKVKRRDYVVLDRHHLKYLNLIERMNCVYCGYVNGVIAYVREIASRTEQYWCPIRHALKVRGVHHRHYKFAPYGDPEAYREKLKKLREDIKLLS